MNRRAVRPPQVLRCRDEAGIFIVLYALLLIGLLSMVAIVIDLNQLRSVRRTSQTVSDFAALAAGAELGDKAGGSPLKACQDAFEYVKKNAPDFPVAATMPCGDLLTASPVRIPCDNNPVVTPPLVMQAAGAAPYSLEIVYPVSAALIDDVRRGGSGTRDGDQCQRMQVRLNKTGGSFFATVFGVGSLKQGASATARGFVKSEGQDTPALVILEKEACGALQASGQGGIVAAGNGVKPGIIAVASAGSTSPGGCTNASNAGGNVVFGTALPAGHPTRAGLPSIEAMAAEDPDPVLLTPLPPILSVWAEETANSARSVYTYPSGVSPDAQGGPRVSRDPVDARYGDGIAGLRSLAAAPPGAYTSLLSILGPGCKVDAANRIVIQANVFIDCDVAYQGGPSGSDEIIFTGTNFTTNRNIDIGSGKKWTFANPSLIVVNRNVINQPSVKVLGTLWMNTGTTVPTATLPDEYCGTSRNGPAFPTTKFVIREGDISNTGNSSSVKLCQTTLYMAHGAASPRPDNENNTDEGFISIGGGTIDWTAPDQTNQPPCRPPLLVPPNCYDSTAAAYQLEDLALWTESAPLSNIGGAGAVFLTGVFFLPNAQFNFTGQALQNIDRNAQFVSRRLNMAGQGTLILKPDPNESVPFLSGTSFLIR